MTRQGKTQIFILKKSINYNSIEKLQQKNTTQQIHGKQITDTYIHTIFTLRQEIKEGMKKC